MFHVITDKISKYNEYTKLILHTRIVSSHKYPPHFGTRFGIIGQRLFNPCPLIISCLLRLWTVWG